jgi:hypothetical protein
MNAKSFSLKRTDTPPALFRKIFHHGLAYAAIAAGLLASFDTAAADWPRFRGPNGSGIATNANPPITWSDSQNVRWKTELPRPADQRALVAFLKTLTSE